MPRWCIICLSETCSYSESQNTCSHRFDSPHLRPTNNLQIICKGHKTCILAWCPLPTWVWKNVIKDPGCIYPMSTCTSVKLTNYFNITYMQFIIIVTLNFVVIPRLNKSLHSFWGYFACVLRNNISLLYLLNQKVPFPLGQLICFLLGSWSCYSPQAISFLLCNSLLKLI